MLFLFAKNHSSILFSPVKLRNKFLRLHLMMASFKYFLVTCIFIVSTNAQFGWIDPWCSPILKEGGPPQTKIVYGEATEKGEIPYQIQILWYWDLVCGGTLVQVGDIQAVITSASCVSGPDPFFYVLQSSDWDLDNFETEQLREVDQVFFPDNYDKERPYENDIAIITLSQPFELNNLTAPIALPPQGMDLNPNGTLLATGWGQWYPFLSDLTCELQKVDMPLVDTETCQVVYNEHGVQLSDSMFCVGQMDGGDSSGVGVGPCGVDFGGPLVDLEAGYLAGVMSHNPRCGYVGYPVVSTRVSHYVDWIESKLNATNLR